jgi:hypothetical protein
LWNQNFELKTTHLKLIYWTILYGVCSTVIYNSFWSCISHFALYTWATTLSVRYLDRVHYYSISLTIYLSICLSLSVCLWLYSPLLNLGRFFSFLIFYTVCRTPWTEDQPVARLLPTHRTAQTQNKRTQISMPQVGFESTILAFERTKTVHALDRAAGHCDRRSLLLWSWNQEKRSGWGMFHVGWMSEINFSPVTLRVDTAWGTREQMGR